MEQKNTPSTPDKNQEYVVTPEGSLGLLAMGYRGLMVWREARKRLAEAKQQERKDGAQKN
jgi:hypothetical protein